MKKSSSIKYWSYFQLVGLNYKFCTLFFTFASLLKFGFLSNGRVLAKVLFSSMIASSEIQAWQFSDLSRPYFSQEIKKGDVSAILVQGVLFVELVRVNLIFVNKRRVRLGWRI